MHYENIDCTLLGGQLWSRCRQGIGYGQWIIFGILVVDCFDQIFHDLTNIECNGVGIGVGSCGLVVCWCVDLDVRLCGRTVTTLHLSNKYIDTASTPCIIVSFVTLISFFVGKKGSVPEGGLERYERRLLGRFLTSSIIFTMHYNYNCHNTIVIILYFVAPLGRYTLFHVQLTELTWLTDGVGTDWPVGPLTVLTQGQQSQPNTDVSYHYVYLGGFLKQPVIAALWSYNNLAGFL